MIGSLRGQLLDRTLGEVTIETNGVGYRVQMTPVSAASLALGDEAFVWIHHHIREDAQTLFGFASKDLRDTFEVLLGTHGVGPSLALAILATHSPAELAIAVNAEDLNALCLVPGVGKKTAQRLLVELKSRLDLAEIDITTHSGAATSTEQFGTVHQDVRDALIGLGYTQEEVSPVLRSLPNEGDTSRLLREALAVLSS